jgi:hypothetical protein
MSFEKMHVPMRRADCWTDWPTERPFANQENRGCLAFTSVEVLRKVNGSACNGCSRCPFSEILNAESL